MDQQDRPDPRRRAVVVGAAVIASLAIAVPAAFAATGGDDGAGSTQTQTQPAPKQDAPERDGDDGRWRDHRGPCPEDRDKERGSGASDRSGWAPQGSGDAAWF